MAIVSRVQNLWRRMLQSWGTEGTRRRMWNREFGGGRWDHLSETPGDCVYPYVEKYASGGDVLDLGCGSGNTGNELDGSAYRTYLGVDISDIAIDKAVARTNESGRSNKNRYVQADLATYRPEGIYRVILFRESLNYTSRPRIVGMLRRYSSYLAEEGVFVVRLYDRNRYSSIQRLLHDNFEIIDEFRAEDSKAVVLVFK